jgi:hypothetical protein
MQSEYSECRDEGEGGEIVAIRQDAGASQFSNGAVPPAIIGKKDHVMTSWKNWRVSAICPRDVTAVAVTGRHPSACR